MLHAAGRSPSGGILVVRTDMEVPVRVALAQIITGRDLAANLVLVEEFARRAKEGGAELVVFPEATMRAFGNSLIDIAEPLDGPWANRVRAISAELGMVIVAGIVGTHWAMRDKTLELAVERTPAWVVGGLLSIMALAIVAEQGKGSAFIYFQF